MEQDFEGLCFVNLVDYDMLYGHRNDVDGYAKALTYFDGRLPEIMNRLREEDILMITADHGCDPGYTVSTDHSREYTPFLMYGKRLRGESGHQGYLCGHRRYGTGLFWDRAGIFRGIHVVRADSQAGIQWDTERTEGTERI